MLRVKSLILIAWLVFLVPMAAVAQKSNAATVQLNATVETSITVSIDNATVTWNTTHNNALKPGQPSNPGSNGITVTTTWLLGPRTSSIYLYAYFTGLNALTGSGGNNIPASNFQISTNAGPMQPVSERIPGYGLSALELQHEPVTDINSNGDMTSALSFNIDLTNLQQLPAGDYTGSLVLQAEAVI
jgi:hypothetical protein